LREKQAKNQEECAQSAPVPGAGRLRTGGRKFCRLLLLTGMAVLCLFAGTARVCAAEGGSDSGVHAAYMNGQNGFFLPYQFCTRAEIAQILSNLTDGGDDAGQQYRDVPAGSWYAACVSRMGNLVTGYSDGTFRPNRYITLAEFVTILARMYQVSGTECSFVDVSPSKWWYGSFAAAEELGWVTTDLDGHCYPEQKLTRAQAAVILNRVLGRQPDRDAIDALGTLPLRDVLRSCPEYYDIAEACCSHTYETEQDTERWTEQSGGQTAASGLRSTPDGLYYYRDDGTLYQTPGLLSIGTETYLVSEYSGRIWCDSALHEINGNTVFCTPGGAILKSAGWGTFSFDANGLYTSGDTALDRQTASIIASCTSASMTQEQKLYACYCRVRSYQYLGRNGVQSGSALPYQTALGFAKTMYTTGKGDCYNFASAFCFLARQLGYDARTVIGKCAYKWNTYAIPHGWVEITIGGTVCLFDAELENYNSRHELSNEIYKAYMVPYSSAPAVYYPN